MGMDFVFQINSSWASRDVLDSVESACAILHDADKTFSLYKPESFLSRLRDGVVTTHEAPLEFRNIYAECEAWKQNTNGWFDAINHQKFFDPSGIVKTWAAKRAALYLESNGLNDFTLNAGGDIYLSSALETTWLWRVGLSNLNPVASAKAGNNMILNLEGTPYRGVATSGSTEKGDHIWAKGKLTKDHDVLQVTVVSEDLVVADIWATAVYAGGLSALKTLVDFERDQEIKTLVMLTFRDGRLVSTPGFATVLANV